MTLTKFKNNNDTIFPNLWDEFFGSDMPLRNAVTDGSSIPAFNISEDEKKYEVEVAAPGMKKSDFKIELDNNELIISSERKEEHEEKGDNKKFTRKEFGYYFFKRAFTLPENADEENIKAQYHDGVLKIEIPKKDVKDNPGRLIDIS